MNPLAIEIYSDLICPWCYILRGLPTKRDAYIIPISVVGIPKTIDNDNGTDPRIAKARGQSSDSDPKKSGEKSS